jgi:DMSO/TMAO reductase YedYZ molybdopterin-dependent catalytic subunit
VNDGDPAVPIAQGSWRAKECKLVGCRGGGRWEAFASISLEKGMDDVIVAYARNGEALRRENGYPLRLVVPGFQGVNNVKYIRSIKAVDKPYYLNVETANYTNLKPDGKATWYEYQTGPKSLIIYPSDAHTLPGRGFSSSRQIQLALKMIF